MQGLCTFAALVGIVFLPLELDRAGLALIRVMLLHDSHDAVAQAVEVRDDYIIRWFSIVLTRFDDNLVEFLAFFGLLNQCLL